MTDPVLPYAGTSGWSGTDTSRERAENADRDGTTAQRQRKTLEALFAAGTTGLTWKELADEHGWHHGNASSSLSTLHKEAHIARLTERRNRCKVYVHPTWVDGRDTEPYGNPARPDVDKMIAAIGQAYDALVAAGEIEPPDPGEAA